MPLVDGHRYLASTAVFLNEVVKLSIALAVALNDARDAIGRNASMSTLIKSVYGQVFSSDSWKLAIPAALYTFQNSLQYVAVSNLPAATFQVTYQLKILTTAVFSVTMLKRSLSTKKWVALVLLMAGVAIVQLPSGTQEGTNAKHARNLDADESNMHRSVGLIAVGTACAISGLAGVYFEKVLKDSTQVSLWIRNVQLSFWSIFPALFIGVIFKDGAEIARNGFFAGYNYVVWTAILFQACGGLLVALVVNYADNIAKNFATSISIIVSCIASIWLFDFVPTINVSFAGYYLHVKSGTKSGAVHGWNGRCHLCHLSLQQPRPKTCDLTRRRTLGI
jgi:UDP-galactose transporter